MIKLLVCDMDGTLTAGTVFYSEKGEEFKQFSHRDGRAFHLIKEKTAGLVAVALLTSEKGGINAARAAKFKRLGTIKYFFDGEYNSGKLNAVKKMCSELNISLEEVAAIGDDTNDSEMLEAVGICGCPGDAVTNVKNIKNIFISENNGGRGAVRDFVEYLFSINVFWGENEN